jgi:flagellar basal body-associated protein FliL
MNDVERAIRDVLNATEVENLVTVQDVEQLTTELTAAINDVMGL